MQVEFAGQSQKNADFPAASTSRLINCYREPVEGGYIIKSVPGAEPFASLNGVFIRAMEEIDGLLYVVCGGDLYCLKPDGAAENLGRVGDGDASISGNNGKVAVSAGGVYSVWDGTAMTVPPKAAFAEIGSVGFTSQITVMTERGGRRFQWSDAADASTIDANDYAEAEGRDDNIIRGLEIEGNYWFFKEKSSEIWYFTGSGFERIGGGVIDRGLKDFGLICRFSGGAFFIGDDGIAYTTTGAGLQPVSLPAVETDIRAGQPFRCFYYEDDGHKNCVIQFNDRASWIYDISTGEWHNRASGAGHDPWRATASAKAFGAWLVGYEDGRVSKLSRIATDNGDTLKRTAVSRTIYQEQPFSPARVEFFGRVGVHSLGGALIEVLGWDGFALVDSDGLALLVSDRSTEIREPVMMTAFSRDWGHTWGRERALSFGAIGHHAKRMTVKGLGQFRQMTVRVDITDPVDLPVFSNVVIE